jgi:hypothetical protein
MWGVKCDTVKCYQHVTNDKGDRWAEIKVIKRHDGVEK